MSIHAVSFRNICKVEYLCVCGRKYDQEYGMLEEKKETIPCLCGEEAKRQAHRSKRDDRHPVSFDAMAMETQKGAEKYGMEWFNSGRNKRYTSNDTNYTSKDLFGHDTSTDPIAP